MPIEIVMIALAGISIPLFALWSNHRQKMIDKQVEISAEKAAQYAANSSKLEERVAVLERIITDQGYSIAHEIEQLRNRPNDNGTPLPEFNQKKETTQ